MKFMKNFGFQISQFFLRKKYSFANIFDKISDLYNKTTKTN